MKPQDVVQRRKLFEDPGCGERFGTVKLAAIRTDSKSQSPLNHVSGRKSDCVSGCLMLMLHIRSPKDGQYREHDSSEKGRLATSPGAAIDIQRACSMKVLNANPRSDWLAVRLSARIAKAPAT